MSCKILDPSAANDASVMEWAAVPYSDGGRDQEIAPLYGSVPNVLGDRAGAGNPALRELQSAFEKREDAKRAKSSEGHFFCLRARRASG